MCRCKNERGGQAMRQLQYGKLCELVETLQEAAVILSDMSDSGARAGLVSNMEFFK